MGVKGMGSIERTNRTPVADSDVMHQVHKAAKTGFSLLEHLDNLATSKALLLTAQTAARSLPYALDVRKLNTWYEAATTRISYLEGAFLSVASAVYNFFIALGASVLRLATLNQVDAFKSAFKKYWSNTALAIACTGVSAVGVVSPKFALYAGGAMSALIGSFLVEQVKELGKDIKNIDFVQLVQVYYEKFYPQIEKFVFENLKEREAKKVLSKLDKAVRGLNVYWKTMKSEVGVISTD